MSAYLITFYVRVLNRLYQNSRKLMLEHPSKEIPDPEQNPILSFFLGEHLTLTMETYVKILLGLVAAELFRRICSTLLNAFTGPLSKIPGPFLSKFSSIPWAIEMIKGTHSLAARSIFEKYGSSIVRIGRS
jgi:hypothetical protein